MINGVGNGLLGLSTAVLVCEIRHHNAVYPGEKKVRVGVPRFVLCFQSRVFPYVSKLPYMSQNFLYLATIVKSTSNQKAAVKVPGSLRTKHEHV